jgi:hypothetical protein
MGWTGTLMTTSGLLVALVLAACSGDDPVTEPTPDELRRLVVDLQDGFDGDDVEIVVNGRSVARLDGVVTDEMLGLAESVEVEVPTGLTELVVRVGVGTESTVELDVDDGRFIGVSRSGDELRLHVASEPFGYG